MVGPMEEASWICREHTLHLSGAGQAASHCKLLQTNVEYRVEGGTEDKSHRQNLEDLKQFLVFLMSPGIVSSHPQVSIQFNSYLSHQCVKNPEEKQLKVGRVYFDSQVQGVWSIKAWRQEYKAIGHIVLDKL